MDSAPQPMDQPPLLLNYAGRPPRVRHAIHPIVLTLFAYTFLSISIGMWITDCASPPAYRHNATFQELEDLVLMADGAAFVLTAMAAVASFAATRDRSRELAAAFLVVAGLTVLLALLAILLSIPRVDWLDALFGEANFGLAGAGLFAMLALRIRHRHPARTGHVGSVEDWCPH